LDSFSLNRQVVIISMVFNMGLPRFKQFQNFIAHASAQNWSGACAELANSLWAKQVPNRAKKYEQMLEQG
jgi:lysozyme